MTRSQVFEALELHLSAAVKEGDRHLSSLQEALASEAKSTAGDKHETGRAMIHQEMRQVNDTLQRSQSALRELTRMQKSSEPPLSGSLRCAGRNHRAMGVDGLAAWQA